jgi:hypothetical protein
LSLALRHPFPPWGWPETKDAPRGKEDAGGAPARAYLRGSGVAVVATPCSMLREEEPGAGPSPCSPQRAASSSVRAVILRFTVAAIAWFTCDPWLERFCS